MAAFGGLFGGNKHGKHPHFNHIAEAIHRNFALALAPASPEVMAALDRLTPRELLDFENAHSIEGLQELFKVLSIQISVDPQTHAMGLSLVTAAELEEELKTEHTQVHTMHMSEDHGVRPIIKPPASTPILGARSAAAASAIAPLPPSFEHLPSAEALCSNIADVFVKYGQLNSADKDILRKIKPTSATVEARIVALERWQAELRRRVRAIAIPKAAARLVLGSNNAEEVQLNAEEQLTHRFQAITAWLGKLIKEFETTGVKYRNKPVWLR